MTLTLGVGGAQAKTLTVDDDRAQCAGAAHTAIQAAVDAAAVNDTIRVCRGTYTEHVRIAAGKRGLKLRGNDKAPPRIVGPSNPAAYSDSGNLAVVDTRAAGVQIRGFAVSGLVALDDCVDVAGIGVYQGSASIDYVQIGPMGSQCPGRGVGIKVGTGANFGRLPRAKVDRSQISSFDGFGVYLAGSNVVAPEEPNVIQRSRIVGPGLGASTASYGIFADRGARFRAQANTVTDTSTGIFLTAQDPGTRVLGNRVTRNQRGIFVTRTDAPALIRSNETSRNSIAGIELFGARRVTVDRNVAADNGFYGIYLVQGRTLIRSNTMRGNGSFDCFDEAGPFVSESWSANIGATQNKPGLCRPPR